MTPEEKDDIAHAAGNAAADVLRPAARRVLMVIQWRDGTGSCHIMGEGLDTDEKSAAFGTEALGHLARHLHGGGGKVRVLIEKMEDVE